MRTSKFTPEQMVHILRQGDSGVPVVELCRQHGISEQTYYRWKKRFGDLGTAEVRELRQLREENRKLKQVVADLTLDKTILKEALGKKVVAPARWRELVAWSRAAYRLPERRACRALEVARSSVQYIGRRPPQTALRRRMREITEVRVHYGYRRVYVLLRREGWKVNHKRVYRLYREDGLGLRRRKPKRRRAAMARQPRPTVSAPNERWTMDFMSDALANGQKLRVLTVVDTYTRECVALEGDTQFRGADVARVLTRLGTTRGLPTVIQCDNGTEFTSRALDHWAWSHGVQLDFSRPGKPTDNATIESFNASVRRECLSEHYFSTLVEAQIVLGLFRDEYNNHRPHSSLGQKTPAEIYAGTKTNVDRDEVPKRVA